MTVKRMENIMEQIEYVTKPKQGDEELQHYKGILDLIEQHPSVAIVKVDKNLHAEYVSPSMSNVLGYSPDSFIASSVMEVVHPEDRHRLEEKISETIASGSQLLESEYRVCTKNGEVRWVETKACLFYDDHLQFSGAVYIQSDITDRKQQEHQLESALKEKEQRMVELNHRVKNNLAMICSLINLKDSEIKEDLADIKNQIDAIRLIHEKLNKAENISEINFREYSRDLLDTIFSSFTNRDITIENTVDDICIPTKTAIPLGIIVNEIATNAIKHGFTGDEKRALFRVDLTESSSSGDYILILSNSGKPLPEDFELSNPKTLGLQLISSLVGQLHGTMELQREPHPVFTIRLPKSGSS